MVQYVAAAVAVVVLAALGVCGAVMPVELSELPCLHGDVLPPDVVRQWREEGVAVVNGLLPADVVDAAVAAAVDAFPGDEVHEDFGAGGVLGTRFPSEARPAVNDVTLHPRMLRAVTQLLGTERVVVSQSEVWAKAGRTSPPASRAGSNRDQRMHVDYPNHSLVHPPPFTSPEAVAAIVYLSHSAVTGGGTAFVRRRGGDDDAYAWPLTRTPGVGCAPYLNNREVAEAWYRDHEPSTAAFRAALYDREERVEFVPGTVLLYRHDVWHRGTPVSPGTTRRVHNLVYKRRDAVHVTGWNMGAAHDMYSDSRFLERLIAAASPLQREVMGFPPVGDSYWTVDTLAWVTHRYGRFGFDPTPYAHAQGTPVPVVAREQ